jgi:hypothetical protein
VAIGSKGDGSNRVSCPATVESVVASPQNTLRDDVLMEIQRSEHIWYGSEMFEGFNKHTGEGMVTVRR